MRAQRGPKGKQIHQTESQRPPFPTPPPAPLPQPPQSPLISPAPPRPTSLQLPQHPSAFPKTFHSGPGPSLPLLSPSGEGPVPAAPLTSALARRRQHRGRCPSAPRAPLPPNRRRRSRRPSPRAPTAVPTRSAVPLAARAHVTRRERAAAAPRWAGLLPLRGGAVGGAGGVVPVTPAPPAPPRAPTAAGWTVPPRARAAARRHAAVLRRLLLQEPRGPKRQGPAQAELLPVSGRRGWGEGEGGGSARGADPE